MRRKKKVVTKAGKQEDKKILAAVKKYGPQPLDGLAEANLFKDDNTVIHFTKPSGNLWGRAYVVQYAVKESFIVLSGAAETKGIESIVIKGNT